jgi:hypothetical protein
LMTPDDERLTRRWRSSGTDTGAPVRGTSSSAERSRTDPARTIVGVAAGFWGLNPGQQVTSHFRCTLERQSTRRGRRLVFEAVSRLKPEVSLQQARCRPTRCFRPS